MPQVKLIEIRDGATFLPALAIQLSGIDGYLARRAGFASPAVQLVYITANRTANDPYDWGDRTLQVAHLELEKNWDKYKDGDVLDVQYLLGETAHPKISEQFNEI